MHLSGNGIVGSFDFIADSLLTALRMTVCYLQSRTMLDLY